MNTWDGDKPECCDLCQTPIEEVFVDGKTIHGPWGIMCAVCAMSKGVGLGEGMGQLYIKVGEVFVKAQG